MKVSLLFAWIYECLVQDVMNTLDDCDLLEKFSNMTNVHEHIDGKKFRSRDAYYNCTRVLCECYSFVVSNQFYAW